MNAHEKTFRNEIFPHFVWEKDLTGIPILCLIQA